MDASDEERLRQLMLGSDSEDELDATPAVPAPAPATAAAMSRTALRIQNGLS